MLLKWSWGAPCHSYWWIMIEFTQKHHSNSQIICLSCPCFPIFAVFFCGWVTADVRAKQQYRENVLIHDRKNTCKKFTAKVFFSPTEQFETSQTVKCKHAETFWISECFIAFCCISLIHDIQNVWVLKHNRVFKMVTNCVFLLLFFVVAVIKIETTTHPGWI